MKIEKIPARYMSPNSLGVHVWTCNINALTENELMEEGFDTFDEKEDPSEESFWISQMLNWARESGLETEVVQWSLKCLKEDPRLTPAMAMREGFNEWIK
jgi:hypothetical protein